jgi:hypothetical protein
VLKELHQISTCSGESEFDSWWNSFLKKKKLSGFTYLSAKLRIMFISATNWRLNKKKREMIFWQPFCENLCDNFISHTHIIFLLSLSIALVSVSLSTFLCKLVVVTKVVTQMVVHITHLKKKNVDSIFFVFNS